MSDFDKKLGKIWNDIDLNTDLEDFKSAIKQAVEKYIIGEDWEIRPREDMLEAVYHRFKGINTFKAQQRRELWGDTHDIQ